MTAGAGLITDSPTIGCAWGDYHNDGRPDLFVSNSIGRPRQAPRPLKADCGA